MISEKSYSRSSSLWQDYKLNNLALIWDLIKGSQHDEAALRTWGHVVCLNVRSMIFNQNRNWSLNLAKMFWYLTQIKSQPKAL